MGTSTTQLLLIPRGNTKVFAKVETLELAFEEWAQPHPGKNGGRKKPKQWVANAKAQKIVYGIYTK